MLIIPFNPKHAQTRKCVIDLINSMLTAIFWETNVRRFTDLRKMKLRKGVSISKVWYDVAISQHDILKTFESGKK
jgi:hypothetical protein